VIEMVEIVAISESHPENMIERKLKEGLDEQVIAKAVISKYGPDFLKKHLLAAIEDPNWVGFTGVDSCIKELAEIIKRGAHYKNDLEQVIEKEAEAIKMLNPSVFYLEGVSGYAPHIEHAIKGKRVVHLDEGCSWYDMVLEMIDSGTAENNPSYGWAQREREKYWVEKVADNLPADGEKAVIKVGHNHLKPNEQGFGYFLDLLKGKGVDVKVFDATIDESHYAKKEGSCV
jgi:hypothetical protein